ncbi:nucleoside triphosphate pyrophosphohydrolase [Scatolibacter rhodanostii]|uniref:nucleoside triphosphate pyrophosphohydrolase n=1 Tax=Scatolibacter rhodanostii TaxID=2014781 RepID=UPI000C084176|nr:nucleoside triphosphate pyrophosphohydrolase [Scatolibacter rhodanostii]
MAIYNKLVRDNIPHIIETKGNLSSTKQLDEKSYFLSLQEKLQEETEEYLEDTNPEELADILEVVYALAACQNLSIADLEAMRLAKRKERGGFDKRVYLISVD